MILYLIGIYQRSVGNIAYSALIIINSAIELVSDIEFISVSNIEHAAPNKTCEIGNVTYKSGEIVPNSDRFKIW